MGYFSPKIRRKILHTPFILCHGLIVMNCACQGQSVALGASSECHAVHRPSGARCVCTLAVAHGRGEPKRCASCGARARAMAHSGMQGPALLADACGTVGFSRGRRPVLKCFACLAFKPLFIFTFGSRNSADGSCARKAQPNSHNRRILKDRRFFFDSFLSNAPRLFPPFKEVAR